MVVEKYPWTAYPKSSASPYATKAESAAWAAANAFRVVWIVPDSRPGLYGWRSEVRTFATAEACIAAASANMGIAKSVRADKWWGPETETGSGYRKTLELYTRKNPAYARKKRKTA